jgi:hypothetical protein
LIYFLGAFYLYFINSVFISLATFLGVRVMQFEHKQFLDKAREQRVRKYIVFIVLLTMCPAIYLTVGIIQKTFYESEANRFINRELDFEQTQVVDKKINSTSNPKEIRVVLLGADVPKESIEIANSKMKDYKLGNTKLVVLQGMGNKAVDVTSIRAMVMEDFYKNSEERLKEQQTKIATLEQAIRHYKAYDEIGAKIVPELKVLYPSVTSVSISHAIETQIEAQKVDTIAVVVLTFTKQPKPKEKEQIYDWLKARTGEENLRLVTE